MEYRVVSEGRVLDAAEPQAVQAVLTERFAVPQKLAAYLLRGAPSVVRRGLDLPSALKLRDGLRRIGLSCAVQDASGDVVGGPGAAFVADDGEEVDYPRRLQVEFTGEAGEYFRIWIVNVVLSILTLGIYSAWAKVRNKRYFYGNTRIGDSSFEYHANPVSILKGRIIAVVLFLAYGAVQRLAPQFALPSMIAFAVLVPWLVVRSMAFRHRNTTFRNVRFGFTGTYRQAMRAFILWPFLAGLSFGLLLPMAIQRQNAYIIGHSRYGAETFRFKASVGDYWGIYFTAGLIAIGGIAAGAAAAKSIHPLLLMVFAVPAYLFAFAYLSAKIGNIKFNATELIGHRFDSRLQVSAIGWIYFTNALAILCTLALAVPWAKVRMARYRAGKLALLPAGVIDQFVAAQEGQVSAVGEEVGTIFDLDFGL